MPKITTTTPPVYDLYQGNTKVSRFPHSTGKSNLKILRFTAPNRSQPLGRVILAGHAPVEPGVLGLTLRVR